MNLDAGAVQRHRLNLDLHDLRLLQLLECAIEHAGLRPTRGPGWAANRHDPPPKSGRHRPIASQMLTKSPAQRAVAPAELVLQTVPNGGEAQFKAQT